MSFNTILIVSAMLVGEAVSFTQTATSAQQQAIETAVASHLAGIDKLSFRGAVLDVRSYATGVALSPEEIKKGVKNSSVNLDAHNGAHMIELTRILGGAAVVADSTAMCTDVTPAACRFEKYSALVSFGVAKVSGKEASIVMSRWEKSRDNPSGLAQVSWHVSLILESKGWRVQKVIIGSA